MVSHPSLGKQFSNENERKRNDKHRRPSDSTASHHNASGFDARDLARQLSVDDFQAYLRGNVKILEVDLKAKLEEESRKQMVEDLARLKALDELERRVLLARKHIEEEIMQLKCPRQSCRRAFFDVFPTRGE